ncbi:MAG: radical SAM protein, partial [Candidatus Omnitrophota bacterium]|nr:radical SAM protein [Candidatus Omnitrophota bacterium]
MFKCKMCLIWEKDIIPQDIKPPSFELIKYFIKSLAELTDKKIILDLIGGEPLMRSDISDLIKTSSSYGLTTTLCTNGYLLDMEMVKLLYDSGLNRLSISLDSLNEQTHDTIRGKAGSYSRVMRALEYLS